jgi:two-component system chemotaxis response regulator CheY
MSFSVRLRLAQDSCADIESDFRPRETAAQFRLRAAAATATKPTARQRPRRAVRVLIADDSAPFREAARALLERRGFLVVGEASTAAAACEQAERLRATAVLLDVDLPDASGYEAASTLTRRNPRLAVLLTSVEDDTSCYRRAEKWGARGFVLKSQLAACDLDRFLAPG